MSQPGKFYFYYFSGLIKFFIDADRFNIKETIFLYVRV